MHCNLHHFLFVLQGELPLAALAHLAQAHLSQVCPTCNAAHAHAADLVPAEGGTPTTLDGTRLPDARHLTRASLELARSRLSRLRAIAGEARKDLGRLLRLPQERWVKRVANTRTRMRSRTFAELLIDESRARVRTDPKSAALLARLVPIALRWTENRNDLPWAVELVSRATAHEANAVRVGGDLRRADRLFESISRNDSLGSPVRAEIASLEASLRIGQRRFEEAASRLDDAIAAYERAADPGGIARAMIKRANLMQTLGRPGEIVPLLDRAAALLGPAADPYLLAVTVTGRVNALCDLDLAAEAEPLLGRHHKLYHDEGDDFSQAIYTLLSGRVALGLDRFEDAEHQLAEARDQLLALDRDYDAVLTSLYLADALLAAGKTAELKRLAADLVPLFHARDVTREAIAALRLFARAAQAESLTSAFLAQVRDRLQGVPRTAG